MSIFSIITYPIRFRISNFGYTVSSCLHLKTRFSASFFLFPIQFIWTFNFEGNQIWAADFWTVGGLQPSSRGTGHSSPAPFIAWWARRLLPAVFLSSSARLLLLAFPARGLCNGFFLHVELLAPGSHGGWIWVSFPNVDPFWVGELVGTHFGYGF